MEATACCVWVSPALVLEPMLVLGGILGGLLLPFSYGWVLFFKPERAVNTQSPRGFSEQNLVIHFLPLWLLAMVWLLFKGSIIHHWAV